MFSTGFVSGHSDGSAMWVEVIAVGVIAAGVAYAVGRQLVLQIVGRIRRTDLESASVVADVVASAAAGDEPDVVVMRAAYDLTRLLELADCRWAWLGDPLPVASLDDNQAVRFGAYRWPNESKGLPPHGVQRRLAANGRTFCGWIVLVPAGRAPVAEAGSRRPR